MRLAEAAGQGNTMRGILVFLLAVVGAWFLIPSVIAVLQAGEPGMTPVPLPATNIVLGAGLLILAGLFWRVRKHAGTAQLHNAD